MLQDGECPTTRFYIFRKKELHVLIDEISYWFGDRARSVFLYVVESALSSQQIGQEKFGPAPELG